MLLETILVLISFVQLSLSASIATCPISCICESRNSTLQAECSSLDFFDKLLPKQKTLITSLKITSSNLNEVNPKIKYLKNLEVLDLTGTNAQITTIPNLPKLKVLILKQTNLKTIKTSSLPKSIEIIDLSENFLTELPKDWSQFEKLRTINIFHNPLDCDCSHVLAMNKLISSGILSSDIKCTTPKTLQNQLVSNISCSPYDLMFMDEGSGDEESPVEEQEAFSNLEENDKTSIEPNEFISAEYENNSGESVIESETVTEHEAFLPTTPEPDLGLEGSGSGFGIIPELSKEEACKYNCITAPPLGANDSDTDSSPPSINEGLKILAEDLYPKEDYGTSTTTTTTTTKFSTESATELLQEVTEAPVVKQNEADVFKEHDFESERSDKIQVEPSESAPITTAQMSDSHTVYTVLGVVCFLIVVILIFFVKKKMNTPKRVPNDKMEDGEEMKALNSEKPRLLDTNPEQMPLVNGKNGTVKEFETFGGQDDLGDVELRPAREDDQFPQRVTIRETETEKPRTPMLIQRRSEGDGRVVSTPVSP